MKYDSKEDIPASVIKAMKVKQTYVTIANALARKMGTTIESLSDDDWRTIYWDRSTKRRKNYVKTVAKNAGIVIETTVPTAKGDMPITLNDYLGYYADPAPNDLLTISQLVSMQNQLTTIDGLIQDALEPNEDGNINTRTYSDLVKVQKELSTETRLLQESLGMSRRQRDSQKAQQDLADHLLQNIKQSKELMDDYGTKMFCPDCLSDGKRILHGFIIDHFPETGITITKRCPVCQHEYTITIAPKKWERHVTPLI